MRNLTHWLLHPLTSPMGDARIAQAAAWFCSVCVLVLGIFKVCRLDLNEAQLLFGLLLVIAVSLLGVLIGLVLPLAVAVERERKTS